VFYFKQLLIKLNVFERFLKDRYVIIKGQCTNLTDPTYLPCVYLLRFHLFKNNVKLTIIKIVYVMQKWKIILVNILISNNFNKIKFIFHFKLSNMHN